MNLLIDNKCIGCELRSVGCHDKCKDYKQYIQEIHKSKKYNKEKGSFDSRFNY